MTCSRLAGCWRSVLGALVLAALLIGVGQRPADAAVTAVQGSACGYFARIGLFNGTQTLRGCGQPGSAPGIAASPFVTLPAGGSDFGITATDPDGARAVFGGTAFFGGPWPEDLFVAPPSGPLTATTQGSPAGGSVTSSVDISLFPEPLSVRCSYGDPGTTDCEAQGGFGPLPVEGDSLHVECLASEGGMLGKTQMVNGLLTTLTDENGSPQGGEVLPLNPPANLTRSGIMSNPSRNPETPGDVSAFTVVINQQIVNADGSLTVNGVHLYLFGPTAVGEVVIGQVNCGTTPHPAIAADTVAPTCGLPVTVPWGVDDPSPSQPLTELVGVFDAGGLQSITNVQVTNGTVEVGQPGSSFPYLRFTPGQTGPLQVTATRSQEAEDVNLPLYWSFVATDSAGNATRCQGVLRRQTPVADFDGSGSTDRGVYRDGAWYVQGQGTVFFGLAGYIPVPADYDGSGDAERAVYKDGAWYVEGLPTVFFGLPGDVPVPGDYDGDGDAERAVFRPSVGGWYVEGLGPFFLGQAGDIPVPGDYDGDGTTDPAVFRDGTWYIEGQAPVFLGLAGFIPVPGDYDDNGTTDPAVFKDGGWYVLDQPTVFFGLAGQVPQPGDYDGDGTTDRAVFDQGTWYTHEQATVFFGLPGDIPLSLPHAIRSRF